MYLTLHSLTIITVLFAALGAGTVTYGVLAMLMDVASTVFHRRSRLEVIIDAYTQNQATEEEEERTSPLNEAPSVPPLWYAASAGVGALWGSAAGPIGLLIGGLVGGLVPLPIQYIMRRNWRRRRELEVQRLLADLHMLTAHMTLGQALEAASKGSGNVRARLRHYVALRTSTTPPVWPLRQLAEEMDDLTLRRVLSRVDTAYKGETELAPLLRSVLDEVTASMKEKAQERIETAAVNLTLPVTFLMLTPVLVLAVAPVVAYVLKSI